MLGLTPYLYLPARAAMDRNNPTNLKRLWYVVSGGNPRGTLFAFGPAELPRRLDLYWEYLSRDFNWLTLAVTFVGLASLLLWDQQSAALLGFLFFGWFFYAIENNISDIEAYFIPTYLLFLLWMSCGAGIMLEGAEALLASRARAGKIAP